MDREKQVEEIDELTTVLYEANHKKSVLDYRWLATEAYNAGYRKADEEEIDAIKKGMHFLLYSMCLQLNLGREIFVKYKIQINNWFENYKKLKKIGAKMDGDKAEAKIKELEGKI